VSLPTLSRDAVDFVGQRAALLSLIEIGLGSFIHGMRIPFGGHALSLYQTYFLTRSSRDGEKFGVEKKAPALISNVAAVLKSLSPAGNKLGPMLSISAQGLLFTLGIRLFGTRLVGYLVGGILMGLWAFVQPLITYLVFFGTDLYRAFEFFLTRIMPFESRYVLLWIGGIVVLKICLSIAVVGLALYGSGAEHLREFESRMLDLGTRLAPSPESMEAPRSRGLILRRALGDLLRLPFLLSLAVTLAFFWYSQREATQIWIYLLRPVAIAFVFFYFSRSLMLIRLIRKLEGTRFDGWSRSARVALENLRQRTTVVAQ